VRLLDLLAALPLAAGCASYRAWTFGPSPQDHTIAVGSPDAVVVRIQVAARGFADVPGSGDPPAVELRFGLRVANASTTTIELASESLELVDGDLRSFGAPRVAPEEGGNDLTIDPGKARRFDLAFPLPEGRAPQRLDLSGLSLRFGVIHEGRVRQASARFERVYPGRAYDPWYDPWWGWRVGIGVGFVHCD
jgi:hypothetical protein